MIPPKYRFFSGKAISVYFRDDTYIDTTTGATETAVNSIASYKMYVRSKMLYINYSPSRDIFDDINNITEEGLYVHMYDSNDGYLGVTQIKKAIMCELKQNTAYVILNFIGMTSSIMKMHKSFVKDGFSETYEVSAVNPYYNELAKKYAKESQQEFFRISLDGKIKFLGSDFEKIYESSLNDELIFVIEKQNTTTKEWYEYYKGKFNKTDCKFDAERKICEPTFSALDLYTQILNSYENTYDLIKLAPELTKIDMFKRSLIQVYVRGADSITNFFGGTYWEDDVNEAVDSADDLINKYFFAYIRTGNEFYIEGAGIAEVNGVYAGINGHWPNGKGYTCYMKASEALHQDYIYVKRDSDDVDLYRSVKQWSYLTEGDAYINREDIEMVNINNADDKFTIKSPFVYHIYQRLLCDIDTMPGTTPLQTHDLPIDDFVTGNKNYKKCIGLKGGNFFCTSRTVKEPTRYGINDYGEYFTNKFIPSSVSVARTLPISRNSWANASLWYAYDNTIYGLWEQSLRKKYTLKDSYSIGSVIKSLLSKIAPTIRHEATAEYSKFLYADTSPITVNKFYVFITQKTNILKGQYDQAAQKAETTLKDIMNMLRDCFRCYWYIENNKFKIEHISYFMNGGSYNSGAQIQLDFTKLNDMFNRKHTSYFQSEIEFNKSELNSRYEFNWMDDVTELFGQVTIDVLAKYVQQDKKEDINVSQFSSDVDFMMFSPSNFSDDGFALLCATKNGSNYELPIITSTLIDSDGNSYQATSQNWFASWTFLASNFYMYDMPAYQIKINTISGAYAYRIKRCLKHNIEFPLAEDLDEMKLIKTSFGNGKIDEYSVNLNTRIVKANLLYEPR